ncbi:hypothetical protein [Streptomyces ficellus]|uniref:Uncharacterized protein n=1 Tax=Streptomyces ficellus TaxID=1977088 RepID=A0A6I6FFC6_9ACTN|nr:hypothetical protein [Streptomyces ficellus]QGV77249.1 hypothetical protein EIZ62_02515 [Streptomyces ficellus]
MDPSQPLTLRVVMNPDAASPADIEELTLWLRRERVFRELLDRSALRFASRARQPGDGDAGTPMGPVEDLLVMVVLQPALGYTATRLLEEAEESVRAWWTARRAQRGEGSDGAPGVVREGDGD